MDVQYTRSTGPLQRIAYSLAEVEAATGISRSSLYNLIAAGKLKTTTVGRRRLVPHSELVRLCRAKP